MHITVFSCCFAGSHKWRTLCRWVRIWLFIFCFSQSRHIIKYVCLLWPPYV